MDDFYALKLRPMWDFFRKEHFSFWMVCGYLFVEYVRPQSIYPALDVLPWARIFLLGGVVAWLFDSKSKWVSSPTHKWMVFFLFATISSILAATYRDVSREHFMDFFSWFIVYFAMTLNINNRKRFYILLLIYLLASFKISASLAYKWAARGFAFTSWGLQGPPGFFANSGELSIQMLVYAPLAFHLYLFIRPHLSKWKKAIMILMPVTSALTVIGASSRGAQLGLAYQVYALLLKGRLSFKNILLTVIVAVLVYQVIPDEQKQRFSQSGDDKTSEQRLRYWRRGMEMIESHPLLGVGFFNFIPYFEEYYSSDQLYERAQLPHNIFIQVGTDSGLLGLSCYVALIIQVFRNNKGTRKSAEKLGETGDFFVAISKGLDTGTLGFLIAGQFVTVGYYPFIWVNLALSVALRHISEQELRDLQPDEKRRR